MVNAIRGRLQ